MKLLDKIVKYESVNRGFSLEKKDIGLFQLLIGSLKHSQLLSVRNLSLKESKFF